MHLEHFELMARYNVWATRKLNQTLKNISDEDFYADCGLYFKSIFGTLNHLLVAEHHLWFSRFALGQSPRMKLDTIVERNKLLLLQELETKATSWLDFLKQVNIENFKGDLDYQTSTGKQTSLPYAATLLHVFNHGTHHRGQITAALTSLGYACPELDLVYVLIEEKLTQL